MSGKPAKESLEQALLRDLDQLYRFAGTVGTTLELGTVIADALEPFQGMAAASQVAISLVTPGGSKLRTAGHRGWKVEPVLDLDVSEVAALGSESRAFASRAALAEKVETTLPPAEGALALTPLWAHGRLLGAVLLSRASEGFSRATLRLLDVAGRQLALAVENAQFFDDLQRSYRRLMDTQEELVRTERLAALGQLGATMAHEIRNPLATIFSALSQIRRHGQVDGDAATLLDIAEEEAVRLNQMVSGLLEFARPRPPRLQEGQPHKVIAQVIRSEHESGDVPDGVQLLFEESGEDLVARFDPDLLVRAAHHMLSNACAAVEPGSGEVRVTLEPLPGSPRGLVFTVTDNGSGIPPEVHASIFEPFFSTRPAGTGLGLPVVKRIAEDHSGTVEVRACDEGPGTMVRLTLDAPPPQPDGQ